MFNKKVYFWNYYFNSSTPVSSALTKTYGVGRAVAMFSLSRFGFSRSAKLKSLRLRSSFKIVKFLRKNLTILRVLAKLKSSRLAELSKFGSKSSRRRMMGLPVNGQRTRSNARTIRRLLRNRSKRKVFY
jgi:small subunit ribosomal protein S13